MTQPKLIMLDLFGTVFNLNSVPREEVKSYVSHVKNPGPWQPLLLPESWRGLMPHADAVDGIWHLRRAGFTVATCSNCPIHLQVHLSKRHDLTWDLLTPLEVIEVYKPDPRAYLLAPKLTGTLPPDVLMVTANRTFGDLEAARALGMQAVLIRDPAEGGPADLLALAAKLSGEA